MSEAAMPVRRKVVIVGAGDVGASFAYALAQNGIADEIVLIDARREQAEGQALDLAHGLPFCPPATIRAGDAGDYATAAVIVITAGAKQRPDESRLNLLARNAAIMRQIMDDVVAQGSEAVVVVVSNPVDILTHVALRHSGWDKGRIIGSGTVLDSSRFRYLLGQRCGVDVRNIHAYILGEHGDSEIAAWTMTHVAGMSMDSYCVLCHDCEDWHKTRAGIVEEVRRSAYHIIDYKGSTCYGIGLALVRDRRCHTAGRTQCAHRLLPSGGRVRAQRHLPECSVRGLKVRRLANRRGRSQLRGDGRSPSVFRRPAENTPGIGWRRRRLRARRSRRKRLKWWAIEDLNLRLPPCQGGALAD